ncbi:hypothetical protein [Streptomyces sp. NPDC056661]|uniref:hypothetical protein n=1 Tax=Streptomyces sp. NPDC056661 TaxID=3345898 RepID=UPI0036BA8819
MANPSPERKKIVAATAVSVAIAGLIGSPLAAAAFADALVEQLAHREVASSVSDHEVRADHAENYDIHENQHNEVIVECDGDL